MGSWQSGQLHQTVNLAPLRLRRFESYTAHQIQLNKNIVPRRVSPGRPLGPLGLLGLQPRFNAGNVIRVVHAIALYVPRRTLPDPLKIVA